jgi:hypothetical protein
VPAASSNTRGPPLIHPYPLKQKTNSETPPPPPCRESICEYSVEKERIGRAEREILVLVYGYYAFPKPSVQGFPTHADPADRSCRYLVWPPTVLSVVRPHDYQRPPRGGRGRCRRACERTPLRCRRRCAVGGCITYSSSKMILNTIRSICIDFARTNATNSSVLALGAPLPLHGSLAKGAQRNMLDADFRTSASFGTPSVQPTHGYSPFALEDGGQTVGWLRRRSRWLIV